MSSKGDKMASKEDKMGREEDKMAREVDKMQSNKLAKQESRFHPDNKEYSTNPTTGPLLSRIDLFFFFLQVHDDVCRQRAICEIVQNQLKFSPLSDFLISLFKKSRSSFLNDDNPNAIRWDKYFYAGSLGLNSDGADRRCQMQYKSCPVSVDSMINIPALKIWQLASEKISIRITDQ